MKRATKKTWIGTSGFQYPEWKGKFFPADLPASRMLEFYSRHFPTTEINYSFRRIPSEATLTRWSEQTPENFRFSLKAPQKITHFAKLRGCEETTAFFFDTVAKLAPKLGPILFQLPPTLRKDLPLLEDFLGELPKGFRSAFEFRAASWFQDDIFATLHKANAALCIAESDDLETPRIATANFGYLRLRKTQYSPAQLKSVARWLKEQKCHDTFVYFKHEETGTGPVFAEKLISATEQTDA